MALHHVALGRQSINLIQSTGVFRQWLGKLPDAQARARIISRIERAARGNFGDVRAIANGVWEMRIHTGPGYRVNYAAHGREVYLLIAGGTKNTQQRDIDMAQSIWSSIIKDKT